MGFDELVQKASLKYTDNFIDIDTLYNDSQFVVKGTVGEQIKDTVYFDVRFIISEIKSVSLPNLICRCGIK
jgi:hypothetical protein